MINTPALDKAANEVELPCRGYSVSHKAIAIAVKIIGHQPIASDVLAVLRCGIVTQTYMCTRAHKVWQAEPGGIEIAVMPRSRTFHKRNRPATWVR